MVSPTEGRTEVMLDGETIVIAPTEAIDLLIEIDGERRLFRGPDLLRLLRAMAATAPGRSA